MRQFKQPLVKFLNDESGATAVEYAVMLALILAVCLTAITLFGTTTNNSFTNSAQRIKSGS